MFLSAVWTFCFCVFNERFCVAITVLLERLNYNMLCFGREKYLYSFHPKQKNQSTFTMVWVDTLRVEQLTGNVWCKRCSKKWLYKKDWIWNQKKSNSGKLTLSNRQTLLTCDNHIWKNNNWICWRSATMFQLRINIKYTSWCYRWCIIRKI